MRDLLALIGLMLANLLKQLLLFHHLNISKRTGGMVVYIAIFTSHLLPNILHRAIVKRKALLSFGQRLLLAWLTSLVWLELCLYRKPLSNIHGLTVLSLLHFNAFVPRCVYNLILPIDYLLYFIRCQFWCRHSRV